MTSTQSSTAGEWPMKVFMAVKQEKPKGHLSGAFESNQRHSFPESLATQIRRVTDRSDEVEGFEEKRGDLASKCMSFSSRKIYRVRRRNPPDTLGSDDRTNGASLRSEIRRPWSRGLVGGGKESTSRRRCSIERHRQELVRPGQMATRVKPLSSTWPTWMLPAYYRSALFASFRKAVTG